MPNILVNALLLFSVGVQCKTIIIISLSNLSQKIVMVLMLCDY